jgi:hypothetical protein
LKVWLRYHSRAVRSKGWIFGENIFLDVRLGKGRSAEVRIDEEHTVEVIVITVSKIGWIVESRVLNLHILHILNLFTGLFQIFKSAHLVLEDGSFGIRGFFRYYLWELAIDFVGDVFLFEFFVGFGFAEQRIITIFDHMFCTGLVEKRDNSWPFLAVLADILENDEILCFGPVAMLLVLVQVV